MTKLDLERSALQMLEDGHSPREAERFRSGKCDVRTGCKIADAKLREVPGAFVIAPRSASRRDSLSVRDEYARQRGGR